jgi:hypothetical protein
MLRVLIGTGILLMAVGFGAAGWQYWQGLPQDPAARADRPSPGSNRSVWLISPTGSVVAEPDSRAFLEQDRLVPERMARLTVTARLEDLLVKGEKLPTAPYLEVLADIRAPRLGEALCPVLTAALAQTCTVHSARVLAGSLDRSKGEARFSIELAYRQDVAGVELPDLASHVLRMEPVLPDAAVLPAPDSAVAALSGLVDATMAACAAEDRAGTCRVLDLRLDWAPGASGEAAARIAWLAPLPEGMSPLSPIIEAQPQG